MGLFYIGYLSLVFLGTILLLHIGKINLKKIQKQGVVFSLILTAIPFTLWDIWAVSQNHWSFGLEHTLGILIVNQPIEEILFFLVVPFFGLTLYLLFQERGEKK